MVAGTAIGAFGTHLYQRGRFDNKAITTAESASMMAASAIAKIDLLGRELNEHRIHDAAMFARLETLATEGRNAITGAENRLSKSLDDFSAELKAMGHRVDRLLEGARFTG